MQKSIKATSLTMLALASGMSGLSAPIYYAGGTCSRQFDYSNIYQARRKNRRGKMQIRRSGMGVK